MNSLFEKTLEHLEDSLTCRLLGSPLRYPDTVRPFVETDAALIAYARAHHFSFVPLQRDVERNSTLVSHVARVDLAGGRVLERAPVTPQQLIAGETPVARALSLLSQRRYLLVLDEDVVDQMLTPSDLNKLPMRLYLFTLLTHMEWLLAEAIDQSYPCEEAWMTHLYAENQRKVREQYEQMQSKELDSRMIDCVTLGLKLAIMRHTPALREKLAAGARLPMGVLCTQVNALRNHLFHGQNILSDRRGDGRDGVLALQDAVSTIKAWIGALVEVAHIEGAHVEIVQVPYIQRRS